MYPFILDERHNQRQEMKIILNTVGVPIACLDFPS